MRRVGPRDALCRHWLLASNKASLMHIVAYDPGGRVNVSRIAARSPRSGRAARTQAGPVLLRSGHNAETSAISHALSKTSSIVLLKHSINCCTKTKKKVDSKCTLAQREVVSQRLAQRALARLHPLGRQVARHNHQGPPTAMQTERFLRSKKRSCMPCPLMIPCRLGASCKHTSLQTVRFLALESGQQLPV
jgi:hypothetical protein